ncbi:MAG: hypothetical protein QXV17_09045 [Candidatus Micrarchaeaceae archaeon]
MFKQIEESQRKRDNSQMHHTTNPSEIQVIPSRIDGLPESRKAAMLCAIVRVLLEGIDRKMLRYSSSISEKEKH